MRVCCALLTPTFGPLPWSGEQTDRRTDGRRTQSGSGWSLHYSCSCDGPELSPYGSSTVQHCNGGTYPHKGCVSYLEWRSEIYSLYLSCSWAFTRTVKPVCTLVSHCQPQSSDSSCLLTSAHPTHVPVFLPPTDFFSLFPPSLHWAFEALSLFSSIPPPPPPPPPPLLLLLLLALKGWSVTELVASFIGVSQQPGGTKGSWNATMSLYSCLCADAKKKKKTPEKRLTSNHPRWKKKAGIQLRMDGGRWGGRRRRRRRRRRGGGSFCNWLY